MLNVCHHLSAGSTLLVMVVQLWLRICMLIGLVFSVSANEIKDVSLWILAMERMELIILVAIVSAIFLLFLFCRWWRRRWWCWGAVCWCCIVQMFVICNDKQLFHIFNVQCSCFCTIAAKHIKNQSWDTFTICDSWHFIIQIDTFVCLRWAVDIQWTNFLMKNKQKINLQSKSKLLLINWTKDWMLVIINYH